MENKRFEHIITRYLKGKATPEEEAELLQAIHASKEWEAAFRKRTAEWNPLEETEADPETDRKWNRIASIITPSESQSQTEEAPVISLVSTSSRRIWFSGLTIACIRSYRLFLESRRKSGNRKCRMANDYSCARGSFDPFTRW